MRRRLILFPVTSLVLVGLAACSSGGSKAHQPSIAPTTSASSGSASSSASSGVPAVPKKCPSAAAVGKIAALTLSPPIVDTREPDYVQCAYRESSNQEIILGIGSGGQTEYDRSASGFTSSAKSVSASVVAVQGVGDQAITIQLPAESGHPVRVLVARYGGRVVVVNVIGPGADLSTVQKLADFASAV